MDKLMLLTDSKSQAVIKAQQKYLAEKRVREALILSTCKELKEEPTKIKHVLSPLNKFQETIGLTKSYELKLTQKAMWIRKRQVEIGERDLVAIVPLAKKEASGE